MKLTGPERDRYKALKRGLSSQSEHCVAVHQQDYMHQVQDPARIRQTVADARFSQPETTKDVLTNQLIDRQLVKGLTHESEQPTNYR